MPIGALGISRETTADLGRERFTTTKAPPAEMLIAVANSSDSFPLPSRARMKTGMASCNRAHFRSSFLDGLRGTGYIHHIKVENLTKTPHLLGQTRNVRQRTYFSLKTRPQRGILQSRVEMAKTYTDQRSCSIVANVFGFGAFPTVVFRLTLTTPSHTILFIPFGSRVGKPFPITLRDLKP